ncbi:unnamed protein product [Blepharisma stoltei]|uniref:RING-type domain-containing protein n=1 Tax=Blepharisma stoltei TaxID=1481888 RepID=A0AAU9JAE3_9CILI|nr:unnamed protein product [Blepharisma stoltei]
MSKYIYQILVAISIYANTITSAIEMYSMGQEVEVSQSTLWVHVQLNSSSIQQRYISISLFIKSKNFRSLPLLVLGFNQLPKYLDQNDTSSLKYDYVDYYSYENHLNDHSIIMDTNDIPSYSLIFVGIFHRNFDRETITYSLKFEESNQHLCQSGCSGHGLCKSINNCICNAGFIGRNCGQRGSLVHFDKNTSIEISRNEVGYLVADLSDYEYTKFILQCKWSGEVGALYIGNPTVDISDLPNRKNHFLWTYLDHSTVPTLYKLTLRDFTKTTVIVSIFNTFIGSENSIFIECQLLEDLPETSTFLNCLFLLCFIWPLILINLLFYLKYRGDIIGGGSPVEINGIPKKIINSLYPCQFWRDIKMQWDTKICIICMEEFKSQSKVRQLICGHAFHRNCIDVWFKNSVSCCVCKNNCNKAEQKNLSPSVLG